MLCVCKKRRHGRDCADVQARLSSRCSPMRKVPTFEVLKSVYLEPYICHDTYVYFLLQLKMDQEGGNVVVDLRWKQNYFQSLSQGLDMQRQKTQYTDTKIAVGEKTFECHRVVLAAMSPFFEAMYMSTMRESSGIVTLGDIDPLTFEVILKFIYSGEDIVDTENADVLLKAAVMLQIKCLQQRCEEFMTENVEAENCLGVWKLASLHGCAYLAQKAWVCVLQCFELVCESEDFLHLDCDDVLTVLKDNDLNTPSEETVCDAVLRWINHDIDNRKQYLRILFEILRLPLVQPEYLLENIDKNNLVQENSECREFVEEAKRFHLLPARRHEFVSTRCVHRNNHDFEEAILCIGGNLHPDRTTYDVSCYSLKQMEWIRLTSLPYDLGVEFAVCSYGNAVYISGGSQMLNGMLAYIPIQNSWSKCNRMLIGRRRHAMVAVGNCLYVLGGFDDDELEEQFRTLMSVERYDVNTGCWEDCGYLRLPVRSASAAVVNVKIYVFGGIDGEGRKVNAVQCFDTRQKTCTEICELPNNNSGMSSAIVCNRTIYLIFPNGNILQMAEDEAIEEIGTLSNFQRCGFGVIQDKGSIVLLGGIDSTDIYDEFVKYDPLQRSVKPTSHQLERPLFGFGCVKATVPKHFFR